MKFQDKENKSSISHAKIMEGGEFLFEKGHEPNEKWGIAKTVVE